VHPVHLENSGDDELPEQRELMTPTEVGKALRVDAKTVTRWVQAARLRGIRTPGGQVRLYAEDIRAIVEGETL
jgi:excisionase family DNA binding protein